MTRKSASRSVKMPISFEPSTTSRAPLPCSFIWCAASSTVVVLAAVSGVWDATTERTERIDMAASRRQTYADIERPRRIEVKARQRAPVDEGGG